MLSLTEIKVGKIVEQAGEPYQVLKAEHHKMGRSGAVLKVKLRNLISSNILDKTFQGNDKVEEADIETKKANFLYKDETQAYLMDNANFEQFSLSLDQIGEKINFLKDGADVDVMYFQDRPVSVDLPVKVQLKVVSAPPGVKGNSAGNVTKTIELETGAKLNAPMFINEGDVIIINTETGEYVGRA